MNIKRAMREWNLQEEQWMNSEEWRLDIGKCRRSNLILYIYEHQNMKWKHP
jgi:hypothetical protein